MEATDIFPKNTTDDFQYLDASDETMGVETKVYPNGNLVKRVTLKDGRKAIVRELAAWEIEEEASKYHNNDKNLVELAMATIATKIDDQKIAFEDLKFLKARDWNRIKYANALINFL